MTFPVPFDPNCQRYPIEISSLVREIASEWDNSLLDDDPLAIPWRKLSDEMKERVCDTYARTDGTYNPDNGHFLCDECYVAVGISSHPGGGWVCP